MLQSGGLHVSTCVARLRLHGGVGMSTNPLEIVLARRGRSEFSVGNWIAGSSLGDLVRRYDEAGIARASGPPPALVALAARNQCVVASDLKRVLESAQEWVECLREQSVPDNRA